MRDPIVIDPPGFDVAGAWQECSDYVDKMRAVGRDTAASFGADPGCCSCPACGEMHWAWGKRQRCTQCAFEYPTDWWSMYSQGVSAANSPRLTTHNESLGRLHQQRLAHPCYRYGFEHPVADAWEERSKIDWEAVLKVAD
jgi:hypothetical protein